LLLLKDPDSYKSRRSFFTKKAINVLNRHLSPDDIENGILGRSKVKWGLAHINKLWPKNLKKIDYLGLITGFILP
jgi:hypothetical protein